MNTPFTATDHEIDRLGKQFATQLGLASSPLHPDITERLRVSRQMAIAQRKPLLMNRMQLSLSSQNSGTLTGPSDEGLNFWSILASALPLFALLAGLMAIQWQQQDKVANEIAAIDAALLTDELPPNAYTDVGFVQFLKHGVRTKTSTHD